MLRNPIVGLRRTLRHAGRGSLVAGAVVLCVIGVDAANTGWLQSSGNYIYHDTSNWVGGVINNIFDSSLTLTGPLTVSIGHDYTTTGDLVFNYVQGQAGTNLTLDGSAFTRPVMTLGGDLHFNPQPAAPGSLPTLNLGSNIILDFGGIARVVDVSSGALVQTTSGGNFQNGTLIKTGAGELAMNGVSYLSATEVRGGKLTSNGTNSLGFGPLSVTVPATLYFKSGSPRTNTISLAADTTLQGGATLSGPINLGGAARTLTLGVAGDPSGDASYEFSGVVSNGALNITGAAGRTGALTLSNANLTTGGTTITGATVTATHPQAFGAGPITLNAGATLMAVSRTGGIDLSGSNAIANPITINADVSLGGSNVYTPHVSEFSGAVTLGSTTHTITATGPVALSGTMTATGSAGLTVAASGTGNLTLSGVNTFPGGVTLNGGRVTFARNEAAGSQTLTLTAGGSASFPNSTATGAGAFPNAIVINGSGNLSAPTSAPAAFSGSVTLNGSLLGSSVTLLAPLTLSGSISGDAMTLAGPVTVPSAGGQLAGIGGSGLLAQGAIGGPGQLTIASGPVYLLSANTYQGGTKLAGGTLLFGDKAALGSGTLTVAAGTTLSAYNTPLTGANAITNPISLTGNFTLASQVPVEFAGTVNLGATFVGTKNVFSGGLPVVTSFTGVMTGSGATWVGDGHVSLSGASTYLGPTTIANYVDLGASALPNVPGPLGNSNSQVALDLSVLNPGGLQFLPASVAILNLQPGVTMGRSMRVVGGTISSSGGETFVTGAITLGQYVKFNVGAGGVMHLDGSVTVQSGDPSVYPVSFNGSGTAIISTGNIVAPIIVNAGKVLYNGTQNAFFSNGVTVAGGGELGGTGAIAGQLTVSGALSPGDGIGTLHTGAVTLGSAAVFKLELNSTARTVDLLSASSAVQLGNAVLSVSDLGGSVLPRGLQFAIVDNTSNGATSGTFLNLPEGATFQAGSNLFAVSYNAALEADSLGNDVILKVIPEPASWALLCLGASAAGMVRRRVRR